MGAVGITSTACARVLMGKPVTATFGGNLFVYITGGKGTPNQQAMACAAGLVIPSQREAAIEVLSRQLDDEEREGPHPWEQLAPTSHGDMYALADATVCYVGFKAPAGSPERALAERKARIVGQHLAVLDLVADATGNVDALPGMRGPLYVPHNTIADHGPERTGESAVYRELRGIPHRGGGKRGGVRDLAKTAPLSRLDEGDAALFYGGAWAWRKTFDTFMPRDEASAMLTCLSRRLPDRLRLPLTVWRWGNNTIAALDRPSDADLPEWTKHGSAASKRAGKMGLPANEPPCVWVERIDGRMRAANSWDVPVPAPPRGAVTVRVGERGAR